MSTPLSLFPFQVFAHAPEGLERITLSLDGVLFIIGLAATYLAWRRLSPRIGHRVTFACGGLILLGIVHFIETAGNITAYLIGDPAEIVHRILVFIGFAWLMVGLWRVASEMLAQQDAQAVLIEDLRREQQWRAQLAAVIEATTDFVGTAGADGQAIYVNAAGRRMVGMSEDEDVSRKRISDFHPAWAARLVDTEGIPAALRDGVWNGETALLSRDGRETPISQLVIAHRSADGTPEFLSTIARDVSERKAFEARLMQLVSTLEATPDLVITSDLASKLIYVNAAARAVLGIAADVDVAALREVDVPAYMPAWASDIVKTEGLSKALRDGTWTGEAAILSADGSEIPTSHALIVHRNQDGIVEFVSSIARDISAQKQLEAQLRQQAFHDGLTGLANRTCFIDRLEHGLARARRTGDVLALLFIDLDQFKSVNDTHGHSLGDRLLVKVGERLTALIRAGDTVARLGGDEFAILLDGAADSAAETTAQRVVESLRVPFEIDGLEVFAHASVGVARATGTADGLELLRQADLAMYTAKADGRDRFEVFDQNVQNTMGTRLALLNDLQGAVKRGEFVLHYQPKLSMDTAEITGVEALVRWNHPKQGLVPPMAFIPIAEESGIIVPLGRWVLSEACRQMKVWQQSEPGSMMQSVAVNVAARQLRDPHFIQDVATILAQSGLDPACLTIEITESATMQDVTTTIAVLTRLKELGVRLSIDDFGTGYSSLSYLKQFPFDELKIDKSFVDTVVTDSENLTSAIVQIGKTLHLKIVAEGVEHRGQLESLRALDCDAVQGYLFSRPVTAEQIDALLRAARIEDAA